WFGRLDGIVNSAGVMALSRLEALCIEDWDRMIDVNLRGTLHGIAAGLPLLQARGRGQIINIAARGRVLPGAAVHGASQQAVRALTEGLRRELGGEASPLRITLIALATNGYENAGRWVDAGAQAIADAVARAHLRDADELVVRCFEETPVSFDETLIRAKSADQRFPASSSGSWAFFGENGARPRSSGANLN
ncbi:MAG TPA: SDR family NAD(P)-dependent oxidoreductase, partial [Roseateles sp.]|nr:SDR family NAD(P)-dependent oxidoreductase [Roseateles sp.]